jgi:NAD(P)-dependent dehydrogenase (short-subunit alcohol dehydrogenase family)
MTYLVVGANSAIGESIVLQLKDLGHRVVSTKRQHTDEDDTLHFDALTTNRLTLPDSSLNGLVYLPGTINLKPFNRLTAQDFIDDFQINLLGAVNVIQQVLPKLKESAGSSIVLFSSVAASKGLPYHASIAAAKSAVEGMGRSLAAELAPQVRVNIIAPSLTDTPLASKLLSNQQRRTAAMGRHPMKDIGKPEDVASVAVFLLTNKSRWITGQVFGVDGGLSTLAV